MNAIDRLRKTIKPFFPKSVWDLMRTVYYQLSIIKYRYFGRPKTQLETSKAKNRRVKEDFFEKYCKGKGLDIGYGGDIITDDSIGWDAEHGDAQFLNGVGDAQFDFAYSSHTIEHMVDPETALKNWWRVIKCGGYLILYLPHRDLFEKKKTLPSRWNPFHKHYFLLDRDEKPHTFGIIPLIQRALDNYKIIYAKECSEGHSIYDPELPSDGEYSIEVVVQKI